MATLDCETQLQVSAPKPKASTLAQRLHTIVR
jgi:hypothetical protein